MKVKIFFCALRRMIGATHLYATAFGSITPYCNRTTSNLMATALLSAQILFPKTQGMCSLSPSAACEWLHLPYLHTLV